jgi:hypothetical protein
MWRLTIERGREVTPKDSRLAFAQRAPSRTPTSGGFRIGFDSLLPIRSLSAIGETSLSAQIGLTHKRSPNPLKKGAFKIPLWEAVIALM